MRKINLSQAINEAVLEEMTRDDTVFVIGECVTSDWGGYFKGVIDKFGKGRIWDTAISEDAIAGSGVGAALAGYRPVVNMGLSGFCAIADDEITHKAAFWRFIHGGKVTVPVVFIVQIGGYPGAVTEHCMASITEFWHSPGLKIAIPSTPYDAKGLLKTSIRDNNPVVYCPHVLLQETTGEVPEDEYTIPFGVADIKREGKDVTVVATAYMIKMALDIASQLEKEGISIEVIDPRTIEPLDIDTIVASVRKTRRLVIADEDQLCCGAGAEIGMRIMENAFDFLDAPIRRIGAANMPVPSAFMATYVLPQPKDIVAAIKGVYRSLPK